MVSLRGREGGRESFYKKTDVAPWYELVVLMMMLLLLVMVVVTKGLLRLCAWV
eukprot:evm.model.NODE_48500_length_5515_cov_14.451496.1